MEEKSKMKKFWEWMAKKDYGYTNSEGDLILKNKVKQDILYQPTKQMLIGYYIEYCIEHKIRFIPESWEIKRLSSYFEDLIEENGE